MSKRGMALIGIAISSAVVLVQVWVLGDDYQAPWYVWLPVLGIIAWSMWQLRDRSIGQKPIFDFNPRRGFAYFVIGFITFPLLLGAKALFGAELTVTSAALFTIAGSIFAGLVGTVTEHAGI